LHCQGNPIIKIVKSKLGMFRLLSFIKRYLNLVAIATSVPSMLIACATKTNLTPGNERICVDGSVQQGQCILMSRTVFKPSNHAYQYIATNTNVNDAFAKSFGTKLNTTEGKYNTPVETSKLEFFKRLAPITLNANLDVPFASNNGLKSDASSSYIDKINAKGYNEYAIFQNSTVKKETNILALLGSNISDTTKITHTALDTAFDSKIFLPSITDTQPNAIAKYINGSVFKGSDTLGLAFNSNFKTMTSRDISVLADNLEFTIKNKENSEIKFYPYYSIPTTQDIEVDKEYRQYSLIGLGFKNFIEKIDKDSTVLFAPSKNLMNFIGAANIGTDNDIGINLRKNVYYTDLTKITNTTQPDGLRKVGFTIDLSKTQDKLTIAETAMINREFLTVVAKGLYDKHAAKDNQNVVTIIPTGTVATDSVSTNFNVLYGQTGYYFVTDNAAEAAEDDIKHISAMKIKGNQLLASGFNDTDGVILGLQTPNAINFGGYIFGKYPFANMYYGSSYAQFSGGSPSESQGKNYDSKLAGMVMEYSKLLGGDGYNNLKKNLLVAASVDIDKDISEELPKVTDGTRGCGAYRDFCISVPKAINGSLTDQSLAAAASLTAVVDSARKIFLHTNAGQEYPYLSDFIKTQLTDKIDFENAKYIQTTPSVSSQIDATSANFKPSAPKVYQFSKIEDVGAFITNRGYYKVIEYYANVAKNYDESKEASGNYSTQTDKTSAIYIGGNKGEKSVNKDNVSILQDKGDLTSLFTDGTTFNINNITDDNILTILKYLVADDVIFITKDGKKYINGEQVRAIATIGGQKIYFKQDCFGIECKILAKDPSSTIQSNVYGYGILNSQEITTPPTKSINIAGKSFDLNDSLVQGSSVTGQNLDGSFALQSIASNVDYTVTFKDSTYNYAANASAALKPIVNSTGQLSNLNSAMFFNQSQFNQNLMINKNYDINGFNLRINASSLNTDKSNPIANLASLNLSDNQSGLLALRGGAFGGEIGKWHFSGFYKSQNNAKSLGMGDAELQSAASLSLGQLAGGMQINNYASVLGFGQKGLTAGYSFSKNLKLESSFAKASNSLTTSFDGTAHKQASLLSFGFIKSGRGLNAALSLGLINEANGFLGAATSGAFGLNSKTGFLTSLFKYNFNNDIFASTFLRNVFVFYSGSFGATKISGNGGVLSANGLIYSSSHLAGFGKKNIITNNDSMSFALNMPLAIDKGSLNATNGSESTSINLARGIKARWVSAELGYSITKTIKTKTGAANVNFGLNIAQANNYYNINGLKSRSAMLNGGFAW
jgi:hypothetical protein